MAPSDVLSQWTVPAGERRCLVAICCSERMIHRETAMSLVEISWGGQTLAAAKHHGFSAVDFGWFDKGVRVDGLRNQAAAQAINQGYTHLLFLDADMIWPTDVIDLMLAHHARGIVSGTYFLKKWPHWPVALRDPKPDGRGFAQYEYDWQAAGATELRREALVGMGCTIIPVAILRRLAEPWFEYRNDHNGQPSITEDVPFCEHAALLNCPIWLDPTIECGHCSVQIVTKPWFHRGLYEHQSMVADDVAEGQKGSAA